ncbi:MAG: hypothetical protein PF638_09595 [Candidatus Delongbacteria bacterium]|jgi:hypothetical protein|nr:hypothetical protein [Candidatus Delongbacteria bacterium]
MNNKSLILFILLFCSAIFAGSYIKDYSSGKRLYEFDGKYVKSYMSGKRLYEVDGIIPRVITVLTVLQGL